MLVLTGWALVSMHLMSFHPIRCFFIAQSYVLVKKWSEALVLYDRVLKYAREVQAQAGTYKNNLKVWNSTFGMDELLLVREIWKGHG